MFAADTFELIDVGDLGSWQSVGNRSPLGTLLRIWKVP